MLHLGVGGEIDTALTKGSKAVEIMSKDRDSREDQSPSEKIKEGEPLMERAMQALHWYHDAQMTQPAEEVERLRLEVKALFAAVGEYQRQALGGSKPRLHYAKLERVKVSFRPIVMAVTLVPDPQPRERMNEMLLRSFPSTGQGRPLHPAG